MHNIIRNLVATLSVVALIAFLTSNSFAQTENKSDKKSETKEIKIKTTAVCGMCKDRIQKSVMKLDGVFKADQNLETQLCTVTYDPKTTDPEKIRKAISKTGYDADKVEADMKAYRKLPKHCQSGKTVK